MQHHCKTATIRKQMAQTLIFFLNPLFLSNYNTQTSSSKRILYIYRSTNVLYICIYVGLLMSIYWATYVYIYWPTYKTLRLEREVSSLGIDPVSLLLLRRLYQ